jgi:hypothetical protein
MSCIVLLKCIHLFVHGIIPSIIMQGFMDTGGLICTREKPILYYFVRVNLGFVNPMLKSCAGTCRCKI